MDNELMEQVKRAAEELKKRRDQINNLLESFSYVEHVREIYHSRYPGHGDRFKGKGVVYTAITGGYDTINEPVFMTSGVDYVLLTDADTDGYDSAWTVRQLDNPEDYSPQRLARWAKMHPFSLFPEYDWSIWVDGALRVKADVSGYIDTYRKESGMVCFPHHSEADIIAEAEAIISHGKADKAEIIRQVENYTESGYKSKGYIVETGVLLRDHHDEKLKKVMDDWWNELCSYGHNRDQMSFDFACWKNGYDYDLNDLLIYGNPWFEATAIH